MNIQKQRFILDTKVMKKIMLQLKNSKMKKTNLEITCKIKHVSCISYLEWMEKLEIVEIGEYVKLTKHGRKVLEIM